MSTRRTMAALIATLTLITGGALLAGPVLDPPTYRNPAHGMCPELVGFAWWERIEWKPCNS